MIPKRIISIWLNDELMPKLIVKCIASQFIPGYEHVVLTLLNMPRTSDYLVRCIENKQWVRAADYLRLYYLNEQGGIYLDADTEILPDTNFDQFLDNQMFAFKEASGYLNNGFIGSEAGHPFLKYLLNTIEHNFQFDQNVFFPGMQFFCESYYMMSGNKDLGMTIYPDSELKDIIIHHGLKSWKQ